MISSGISGSIADRVGPIEPTTKTSRPTTSRASRAILTALEVDVSDLVLESELGQLELVGAIGIGLDDVRAGRDIGAVNRADQIGVAQVEMIEARAHRNARIVDERTHGAIRQ